MIIYTSRYFWSNFSFLKTSSQLRAHLEVLLSSPPIAPQQRDFFSAFASNPVNAFGTADHFSVFGTQTSPSQPRSVFGITSTVSTYITVFLEADVLFRNTTHSALQIRRRDANSCVLSACCLPCRGPLLFGHVGCVIKRYEWNIKLSWTLGELQAELSLGLNKRRHWKQSSRQAEDGISGRTGNVNIIIGVGVIGPGIGPLGFTSSF
jgi:hypothetical protein